MPLSENPESISSYADLAQYVGRRVSVNAVTLDHSTTNAYVARTDVPRVEGVLKQSGDSFVVEPDGEGSTLSQIPEYAFQARDPKLED